MKVFLRGANLRIESSRKRNIFFGKFSSFVFPCSRSSIYSFFALPQREIAQDIAEMTEEFQRKLAATESQLSAVVRSRLDGVKRSRDLIEESAAHISKLHEQFAKMEE